MFKLEPEIEAVFRTFRTCEFSTLAKDGTPITWPVATYYQIERQHFILTTAIGLPNKAYNIRRNPRVSMLFSDPTASGQSSSPAVLVQGDATAPDKIITSVNKYKAYWCHAIFSRQPASSIFSNNPLMRHLMDWYYMRLIIQVRPRRILYWPNRDFGIAAREVAYVG